MMTCINRNTIRVPTSLDELKHDHVLEGSIMWEPYFPCIFGTNNIALVGDTGFEPVTSTV
jgi:hypothetical protein